LAYITLSSNAGDTPLDEIGCLVENGKYGAIRRKKSETPSRSSGSFEVDTVVFARRYVRDAEMIQRLSGTSSVDGGMEEVEGENAVGADSRNVDWSRG
jgi:hypothetical protein